MQQFGTLGLRVLFLPPAGFQAKRSEGSSQRSGRTADEVVYKRRVDFVKVVYPKNRSRPMTFELLSNISLVQFGSFVGLLNGAYTLYMLLARAKIRLFLADSIGIVHPPREVADRFHLACNFVNARGKVGAVHRLEATVLDPEKNTRRFEWNLFYEYGQRGQELLKTTDPFPIAVLPRSNAFHFIEFKLTKGEQIKYWPQGLYEFNILGWANRRDRKRRPNITATFHIEISNLDRMGLHGTGQDKPIVFRFPIVEWSLQDRPNRKRWWRRFIGS